MLVELTSISQGFNSVALRCGDTRIPFLQPWCLGVAVTIEATRGLKGCRADWEMGHIICPWNIMWHNMTPGHLYVKVNISAWRFDKSGQGSCQCGFILAAEKEVLWHRVAMECVGGTLCLYRASVHKFNPHRHKSVGLKRCCQACSFVLVLSCWKQTVDHRASQKVRF